MILTLFYHIKNLQSTKTPGYNEAGDPRFYHIKNLQSTKTEHGYVFGFCWFYHIKNLQSTKTSTTVICPYTFLI